MVRLRDLLEKRIRKELEIKENESVSFAELITPAFIGGLIIGIILGIPGLNIVFPLAMIGGYYAVYLVRDYYEKYITISDGMKVGVVAGIIGAFFGTALIIVIAALYGDNIILFFRSLFDFDTANILLILSGIDPYLTIATLKMRFFANLAIGIGMGGIGGAYFIKRHIEEKKRRK
ncbi:MAG: hypothetical protein NZ903_01030 [Candidatus Micrarchaeota archaeon]|nr:hypothetical protein [Candidatus Micrarchaeota archaeon]